MNKDNNKAETKTSKNLALMVVVFGAVSYAGLLVGAKYQNEASMQAMKIVDEIGNYFQECKSCKGNNYSRHNIKDKRVFLLNILIR
jgi:hypothetical protein